MIPAEGPARESNIYWKHYTNNDLSVFRYLDDAESWPWYASSNQKEDSHPEPRYSTTMARW